MTDDEWKEIEKYELMRADLEEPFAKMGMEVPMERPLIKTHHARLFGENYYE